MSEPRNTLAAATKRVISAAQELVDEIDEEGWPYQGFPSVPTKELYDAVHALRLAKDPGWATEEAKRRKEAREARRV